MGEKMRKTINKQTNKQTNNKKQTKGKESIYQCLKHLLVSIAHAQSWHVICYYNFYVMFTALTGEYNSSRRGRLAKSHFPCVVYYVFARYSILFDVHI